MISPKSIFVIRHGESTVNAGGLSVESKKVQLTVKGERQAQLLAYSFNHAPSGVLVSELKRVGQTAAPYCTKHQQTPRIEPLLNEFETLSFELIDGLYGEQTVAPWWMPIARKRPRL